MGHSTGISNSYYRPTDDELLDDYIKVIPLLTITDEHRLQEQVNELSEKPKDNDYAVRANCKKNKNRLAY